LFSSSGSVILNGNFKEYEGKTNYRSGAAHIIVAENSGSLITTPEHCVTH
jgi:hypothetical protein